MSLKNSWIFPIVQSIHLCGIALLVGSIVIQDFRVLNWVLRRHPVSEVALRFAPWARAGFAIMLTTGPVLFVSDVPRYVHNRAFLFKMVALAITLVFHFNWRRQLEEPGKLVAFISIGLWTCVVLGGRAIADFDI